MYCARRDETGDLTRGTGGQEGWGRAGPEHLPLRRGGDQTREPGSGRPLDGWLSRYGSSSSRAGAAIWHCPFCPALGDHEKRRARRNGRALKGDALTWD